MKTKIEWLEIPAPDLDKAKSFYSIVFNWTMEEYTPEFCVFNLEGFHGGLNKNRKRIAKSEGIIFSISVDDINTTLDKIVKHGGKIIEKKYEIGKDIGFAAMFSDPNGNHIELWSKQ
jgi:hypothetical protein